MQRGFITIEREKLSPYLTKVHCLLSTTESLSSRLPSTATAQHETELEQASGSTSETEHTNLQQSKVRNFNYSKTGKYPLGSQLLSEMMKSILPTTQSACSNV